MKNTDAYLIGVISTGVLILVNTILLKFLNLAFPETYVIIYFLVAGLITTPVAVCIVAYINSKGLHDER